MGFCMNTKKQEIYCCGCGEVVSARLTDGSEVYRHRRDLHRLPFWKCDSCKNFVGCHHKTKDPTKPLGVIPTTPLKRARQKIHRTLDPIWKGKQMSRGQVYLEIARQLGIPEYHTANIRSIDEAEKVHTIVLEIAEEQRRKLIAR